MTRHYRGLLLKFRELPPSQLLALHDSLPPSGCGWPTSNYRRALERAMREKRPGGASS